MPNLYMFLNNMMASIAEMREDQSVDVQLSSEVNHSMPFPCQCGRQTNLTHNKHNIIILIVFHIVISCHIVISR